MRYSLFCLMILAAFARSFAQSPDSTADSLALVSVKQAVMIGDTMFVLPAGPIAGCFTAESRLSIEDTVAGWAKIRVEGWVPLRAVLARMVVTPVTAVRDQPVSARAVETGRCQAVTKKGTPCSRKARPGSRYCWQHQPK